MSRKALRQYTVRDIPESIDRELRRKAKDSGKSLNLFLVETLSKEAGIGAEPRVHDDLDALIGSWVRDPETEKALGEQRIVNPKDWD